MLHGFGNNLQSMRLSFPRLKVPIVGSYSDILSENYWYETELGLTVHKLTFEIENKASNTNKSTK